MRGDCLIFLWWNIGWARENSSTLLTVCKRHSVTHMWRLCLYSTCVHLCHCGVCLCDSHLQMNSFNSNQSMLSLKEPVIATFQLGMLFPNRRTRLSLKFKWVCNIFNAQFHLQEIRSKMRYEKWDARRKGKHSIPLHTVLQFIAQHNCVHSWRHVRRNQYWHVFCFLDCKIDNRLSALSLFRVFSFYKINKYS